MRQQAALATWSPERDVWETDTRDLFSEHSDVYSVTLPKSGMTRNGRLFPLTLSGHPTGGNECSSQPDLAGERLLPTPRSNDHTGGVEDRGARGYGDQLNDIPYLLPTPMAQLSGNSPEDHLRKKPGRTQVTDLAVLVENDLMKTGGRLLPTPTANLAKSGVDENRTNRVGSGGDDLTTVIHDAGTDWGPYEAAIRRWTEITGQEPPSPTEVSRKGKRVLAAPFAEWMMGLPFGWVTGRDIGLTRSQSLRAIGNGVVTRQAEYALRQLDTAKEATA